MHVRLIWPDGSMETIEHTLLRGRMRKRDNGEVVRPLAGFLVKCELPKNLVEYNRILKVLREHGIFVPPEMVPLKEEVPNREELLKEMREMNDNWNRINECRTVEVTALYSDGRQQLRFNQEKLKEGLKGFCKTRMKQIDKELDQ